MAAPTPSSTRSLRLRTPPPLALFSASADPRRYLPRTATENALRSLGRRLHDGRPVTLLAGPEGIGKSLLLRVLGQRVRRELRVVELPVPELSAEQLCVWVRDSLRGEREGDPELALLTEAERWRSRGSALVLAIDDAQRLPIETARRLAALVVAADGGLRLVLAVRETALDQPAIRILLDGAAPVMLSDGMSWRETNAFVRAALAAGRASRAVRELFDASTLLRLHRRAEGIPHRVNALAAELLDRAERDGVIQG